MVLEAVVDITSEVKFTNEIRFWQSMLDEEIGSSRVCGAALICITGTWMADIFARHPPITDSGFSYASERRNCQKSIPPPFVDSFGYMRAFPNGAVVVWTFPSRRQFGGLHSNNVQLSSLAQISQTSQTS